MRCEVKGIRPKNVKGRGVVRGKGYVPVECGRKDGSSRKKKWMNVRDTKEDTIHKHEDGFRNNGLRQNTVLIRLKKLFGLNEGH